MRLLIRNYFIDLLFAEYKGGCYEYYGSIINSVGWWIPYVRFTTHIE